MAGLRKDVELIFRGEDRASPTIGKVRKSVSDLSDAIAAQVAAAERGEGSVDELAKAYRALKDAQGDVTEITRLASAYETVTTKLAEQSRKVDEARQKEAALAAEVAAATNPTKRLQNSRDAAARSLDAAIQKEAQLQAQVRELGAALDAAGGDSANFAATQERIKNAALETARAIRDAAAAMDQFKGKQAQGKANIAAQEEALRFNQLAASSGLPQEQIAFISGLENRVEALSAAMKEAEVAQQRLNAAIEQRKAAIAATEYALLKQRLDEAAQAAIRFEAAAEFKQTAAEIEAAARETSRFGVQADSAATSGRRLADTIQAILNPTNAAANSLAGVNGIIAQSESVLDGAKRRMSQYNEEINNLQAAMSGLQSMARLIDDFRRQESAVAAARAQFDAAQANVIQLAQAIQQAEAPTEQMANALQQAEAKLEAAGAAMQRETTKLSQLERGLEAAKIDVNNLALAEETLTVAANRAAIAQQNLRNKTSGVGGFMGLNPMELQNLGFQINDIVVGLASGQRPLTVFMQQGLQIGQIIPGAFAKIVRYIPQLAALAAVLLTVGGAMAKAARESDNLKLGEDLARNSGAQALAADFADLAESLHQAGVEADKTREILTQLSADGLNAGQMEAYILIAKDMATVTGVELPEALETLRAAFQGGFEDIVALDDKTNAYTDTELDLIQTLFEQGRADEARTAALAIYASKMEETAANSEGPWSRAIDNLGIAWDNFLGSLKNLGPIRAAIYAMGQLGELAAYVSARLAGKGHEEANKIASGQARRATQSSVDPNRRTNAGRQFAADQQRELAAAKATTAEQKRTLAVEQARLKASKAGLSSLEVKEAAARAGAIFDAQEAVRQEKRDKAAAKRGDAAARRAEAQRKREARAAEAAAKRIEAAEEALARQLEQIDAAVANKQTDSLDERLSAIDSKYAKLFRDLDDLEKQTGGKGRVGNRTIDEAREHVRIQQQQLKNYETMEFYEKRIADITNERNEKLDTIADKVARGILTPEQGLAESKTVIDEMAKKATEMAEAGLAFALSIRGAKPDPALDALIAKFQNVIQNNSGGQNQRAYNDVFTGQVEAAESRLNMIIGQRNQLIDMENLKVQMGLQTRRQAQENITQHYAQTKQLILDHVAQIEALARSYSGTLTPEMQLYFDTLRARIQGVKLESDGVDASFVSLKQSVDHLLTSNIVGFIDSVAQSFAKLVSGQSSVMGFFASIGQALLKMIANILQTVAMLIIQALILDAVDKATGGILKPLLKIMAATVSFNHEGGIVGRDGFQRSVSPVAFADAPRYHNGGIAGLAPDEVATVLRRNEEVLTEEDPRHRFNGGLSPSGPSQPTGLRQILVIGDDEIAGAMAGAAGEDVVMTHLRRNRATVKQILG